MEVKQRKLIRSSVILPEHELFKLHEELKECLKTIEAGLDLVVQLKDQNCILPGEIDGFEERASALLLKIRGKK